MSFDCQCDCNDCGSDIDSGDACYCNACYKASKKVVEGVSLEEDLTRLVAGLNQVLTNLRQGKGVK
jgi:hypothetical protein